VKYTVQTDYKKVHARDAIKTQDRQTVSSPILVSTFLCSVFQTYIVTYFSIEYLLLFWSSNWIHRLVMMVYYYNCLLFTTQLTSVPRRKHITSPLRAQQVNFIYRFVTTVYLSNYHNSGYYPSSCLLFKTQLNSLGLRKHLTSPLRAQQVNALYRFVTTVY
jgi:hypothetical protein